MKMLLLSSAHTSRRLSCCLQQQQVISSSLSCISISISRWYSHSSNNDEQQQQQEQLQQQNNSNYNNHIIKKQRRPSSLFRMNDPALVDPNTIWKSYYERYQTLPHGTSFREQRKSEQRWNWRILIPNFINTSPAALSGAGWHALYASLIIAPHQLFHQNRNVQQLLATHAENLHLPWTEFVTYVEPLVQYHDLVSGDLLATFSIYSTAIFLIVSMRLTGAMTYQRDGHAAYTDLVTEVLTFSQKVQLYCTDKRVAVELSRWAYATVRATELHLQNVHDPALVRLVLDESLLLQQTQTPTRTHSADSNSKTIHKEEQEQAGGTAATAAAATERVIQNFVRVPNRPLFALQHITTLCHDAFDRAVITNIRALIDINGSIGSMMAAFQRCVQLQAQPEPYSYNLAMKIFLQLWVGLLPLVIVPSLHLVTIPASTGLAFFVYKLDEISAEMQNPYGHDASDIALGTINERLHQDLSQLIHTYEYNADDNPDAENATTTGSSSSSSSRGNTPSITFPMKKHTNLDNPRGKPGAGDWEDNGKLVKRIGLGNLEENTKSKAEK